ncbi:MAG: hypothetical protein M3347_00695 [Armatimonadota bacterium]|nr:hypothetical protein [Armatimonadota bacterium]
MKKWRSRPWIIGSLVALLAAVMPSLAWACPMTGRIGDAAIVCHCAKAAATLATTPACAESHGKCCKQLPVPSSDTNQDSRENILAFRSQLATVSLSPQLTKIAQAGPIPLALPSPPPSLVPVRGLIFDRNLSPPHLAGQHAPPTHAGRAPPVLS